MLPSGHEIESAVITSQVLISKIYCLLNLSNQKRDSSMYNYVKMVSPQAESKFTFHEYS